MKRFFSQVFSLLILGSFLVYFAIYLFIQNIGTIFDTVFSQAKDPLVIGFFVFFGIGWVISKKIRGKRERLLKNKEKVLAKMKEKQ